MTSTNLAAGTDYSLAIISRPSTPNAADVSITNDGKISTTDTISMLDNGGIYTVTATGQGNYTNTVTATFTLNVTAASVSIEYDNKALTAIYDIGISSLFPSPTYSPGEVSYSIDPDLNDETGLILDPDTGVISGTPTKILDSKNYTVTIEGKDGTNYEGMTANFTVNITVSRRNIAGTLSYSGNIDTTYGAEQTVNPQWTGEPTDQTVTYAIAPALPSDINFDTNTGALYVSNMTAVHTEKTYTISATGTGNYTGKSQDVRVSVKVKPKTLSAADFSVRDTVTVTAVTANEISDVMTSTNLAAGTDYSLAIISRPSTPNAADVSITNDGKISTTDTISISDSNGIYTVRASGTGNCEGTVDHKFTLTVIPRTLTVYMFGSIDNQDDFKVTPGMTNDVTRTLSFNNSLTIGSDFTLAISSIPSGATAGRVTLDANTGDVTISKDVVTDDLGTYTLSAAGQGNYSGTVRVSLDITVKKINISGTFSYADLEIINEQTIKSSEVSWNNAAPGQTVRYTLVSPTAGISIDENTGIVTVDASELTADTSCSIRAEGTALYTGETTADLNIFIKHWIPSDVTLTYSDIRVSEGSSASSSPQWSRGSYTVIYDIAPLNGGILPKQIEIDPASGEITVDPNLEGQADTLYQVTATATGSWKGWKKAKIRISIYENFYYEFQPGIVGQPFSLTPLQGKNISYYSATGFLPEGLIMNSDTGEISGTPETRQFAKEYTIKAVLKGGGSIFNRVYLLIREQAVDKAHLKQLIDEEISSQGNTADLGIIDTSSITDMSDLFDNIDSFDRDSFNGDLSEWDVSSVTDMRYMFQEAAAFNGDLSEWDVSSVTNMRNMFNSAQAFDGDISAWNVSSVTDMRKMFWGAAAFNGDISAWNVSNVTSMDIMFASATKFNGDISAWNVSSVTSMDAMFSGAAAFNGDLSEWSVSSVTNMDEMFNGAAAFNGDISEWDVSSVTSMQYMFSGAAAFNGDISEWNVASVTDMHAMFDGAAKFNGDLSKWKVSKVTNMGYMFNDATAFNGDLSEWDVSSVTDMRAMFDGAAKFNGDLSGWKVSSVTSMRNMFNDAAAFNGDLSGWTVSSVTSMRNMFNDAAAFNGDLSEWNVSSVTDMQAMFDGAAKFNEDISKWKVSKVTNMSYMFSDAIAFNGDLSEWDVSSVTDMRSMFYKATAFNGDISEWNVSSVTKMDSMFQYAQSFNGDLSGWNVSSATSKSYMFSNSGLASNQPSWYWQNN